MTEFSIFGSTIPLKFGQKQAHYHKKSHNTAAEICIWIDTHAVYNRRLTRVWSQSQCERCIFHTTKTALTQISDALLRWYQYTSPSTGAVESCERSYRWKEIRPTLPQWHTEENQSRLHASSLLSTRLYLHFLTNDWNYYITQQAAAWKCHLTRSANMKRFMLNHDNNIADCKGLE